MYVCMYIYIEREISTSTFDQIQGGDLGRLTPMKIAGQGGARARMRCDRMHVYRCFAVRSKLSGFGDPFAKRSSRWR